MVAQFIVLPWVAPLASAPLFLFLTILWSVSSSALARSLVIRTISVKTSRCVRSYRVYSASWSPFATDWTSAIQSFSDTQPFVPRA